PAPRASRTWRTVRLAFAWLADAFFLRVVTSPGAPEISPLSLRDALPISRGPARWRSDRGSPVAPRGATTAAPTTDGPAPRRGSSDRKSTRLNSSHVKISYAVFCLKKKNRLRTLLRRRVRGRRPGQRRSVL